jgi:hypothetical protein
MRKNRIHDEYSPGLNPQKTAFGAWRRDVLQEEEDPSSSSSS